MKKKILLIASLVIILAMLAIGGSLVWFTDNDEATNVFTIGSVEIDQIEQQYKVDANGDKTTELEDFKQEKVLLPIVNVTDPSVDPNYQDKIVTVKSLGNNPAYVSTHIAIPTVLKDILVLDLNAGTGMKWEPAVSYTNTTTVNGESYTVYSFVYTEALDADDATALAQTTDPLLKGVYLKPEVDCQEAVDANGDPILDANGKPVKQFCTKDATTGEWVFYDFDVTGPVNVLVATQGCQSQGFSDAHTAIQTAFGAIPNFTVTP